MDHFQIVTVTPGLLDPSVLIATQRAKGLGILDFEYVTDWEAAANAIKQLQAASPAAFGLKIDGDDQRFLSNLTAAWPEHLRTVVLTSREPEGLADAVLLLKEKGAKVILEISSVQHAVAGEAAGFDGLIVKGNEAGGRIANETTFILLQRLAARIKIPVWAHGGVGLHTAAACAAAGAAGVVLDWQLALTRESPLSQLIRSRIALMDGSETVCLGEELGESYRLYFRLGSVVVKDLREVEARLAEDTRPRAEVLDEWRRAVAERAGTETEQDAWLLGQDAGFAASLAKKYQRVGPVIEALRMNVRKRCQAAEHLNPIAAGSKLAAANGTRYPILQGPMTRVSDVPEFAERVASGGALPFLALALMRGPEVEAVLAETQRQLGSRPWGVGILGFVPPELRQEQLEAVRAYKPPFALIAGGRPDQALSLEREGISTYLHVPSPGLLRMFVQQGARRVIFEGRECGGHVGPRTSFVLWEQMVDVLLDSPEFEASAEEFHVIFAGGVHDALSAAMVSVIAAPLIQKGGKVGVLLGTAYLFTEEAVASNAIKKAFQEQATKCIDTVLLETGPGHSIRCVDTPFAIAFSNEKRRLTKEGRSVEEVRIALEELTMGRLRVASKGVTRNPAYGEPTAPKLVSVNEGEQVEQGMYMIGQVAALHTSTGTIEALHQEISVGGTEKLNALSEQFRRPRAQAGPATSSDVAIIGMACLLPKAPDLESYWTNILGKVNAVTEIPKERWDWETYFDSDPKAKDKIYSKWGGFLDDVAFDPMRYGMPPATLRSIEPAQLLTLEVVRAALADAGYLDRKDHRETTSVILGAGGGAADLGLGYGARTFVPVLENLPEFKGRSAEILERLGELLPEWTEDSFAGILANVAAGRVANRFDFGGSNYTVDAACASSLAAVAAGLNELESRTSDMVVVGGFDTMQNPFTFFCFSKTHALSPRGRCRTFDETADGIAISEGVAILVLKRLEDAERDGDRVYAVIKGAGSSSDGRDRGLTAPRPEGQARALRRAYSKAGVSPASVGLVEAHGTGTVAGDSAEVQALTSVFSEAQAATQSCAIGSVKSMIGHTKCSAGAAGLIKAALALQHKVLPPTLGVDNPNPKANFPETPFFVNTEPRPWLGNLDHAPRRAGVSAFGFGGTNFHIVMEEYAGDPADSPTAPCMEWPEELFIWRGESRAELSGAIDKWAQALVAKAKPPLRDLAYTAWKAAQESGARGADRLQLAIVAGSLSDLQTKLGWARTKLAAGDAEINDPRGIYFAERPPAASGKLAFLFPGQGSQYPHMLQDLLIYFPEIRNAFETANAALAGKLPQPLSSYVFPPNSFSSEQKRERSRLLTQTNVAQPALGAAGLAMFSLLTEFGLEADMLAGHSYGEYVALAAAGAFNVEDLIALSEARGRFIVEGAGDEPGTMAAVEADADAVNRVIKSIDGVCLANANAPRQSVISGSRTAVEAAIAQFSSQGITARLIPVACAFHSSLVEPAKAPLAEFISKLRVGELKTAVYSNMTAAPYSGKPDEVGAHLAEHLVKPVEFVREIEAMYEAGARVFVEVGPRSVLSSLVGQILGDRPGVAVATNSTGRPGLTNLLHSLGQLAAHGYGLKLDRLYQGRTGRRVNLNAIEDEYGAPPLSPSVWMVNGSRATPLKKVPSKSLTSQAEPAPAAQKRIAAAAGGGAPVSPRVNGMSAEPAGSRPNGSRPNGVADAKPLGNGSIPKSTPQAAPPPERPSNRPEANGSAANAHAHTGKESSMSPMKSTSRPGGADLPASSNGSPDPMAQFQQMMTRFLDTQKTVMLEYLRVNSATPGAGRSTQAEAFGAPPAALEQYRQPRPTFDRFAPSEPEKAEEAAATSTPAFAEPARLSPPPAHNSDVAAPVAREAVKPSSGPNKQELTQQLLSIVSERTGYPTEMIELTADLEADLGIDSIKRVEILGTLQQSFAGDGGGLEEGLMEKLSAMRTLQAIVDQLSDGQGEKADTPAAPDPRPFEQEPPQAGAGMNQDALVEQLLAIVSERTGYPAEMLDLNSDLEADLGIDSIKRVEILGTFQQGFSASGIVVEEGLMEKLAGVRTLRGIVDQVLELVGPGQVPESAPKPTSTPHVNGVAHASEPAPHHEDASRDSKIGRYTLKAIEAPLTAVSEGPSKDHVVLITDDGTGIAEALVVELERRGHKTALVRPGASVEETGPGVYSAPLGSAEAVTEVVELVEDPPGFLGSPRSLASVERFKAQRRTRSLRLERSGADQRQKLVLSRQIRRLVAARGERSPRLRHRRDGDGRLFLDRRRGRRRAISGSRRHRRADEDHCARMARGARESSGSALERKPSISGQPLAGRGLRGGSTC